MRNRIVLLVIMLFSIVLQAEIQVEKISPEHHYFGGGGDNTVLDKNENLHIFYGGNALYHKWFDGVQWQFEIVDNNRTARVSVVNDNNGNLHVAYFDKSAHKLKYTTNITGTWQLEDVDSGTDNIYYYDIALNSHNSPCISYTKNDYGNPDKLMASCRILGNWVSEEIDSDGSISYVSTVIDSNDHMHIAYYQFVYDYYTTTSNIKHAVKTAAGDWDISVVDSANGNKTNISIDSNDVVHIGYYDGYDSSAGTLIDANNSSGSWALQELPTDGHLLNGTSVSMILDAEDHLHVSYHDWTDDALKYMNNADGSWSTKEDIEDNIYSFSPASTTVYNHMAIDSSGKIYNAYFCNHGELHYATNLGGNWTTGMLDTSTMFTNLKSIVDGKGNQHIIYYERIKENFYYAVKAGETWQREFIAKTIGNVDLSVDSDLKVHIVFIGDDDEGNHRRLRYASNVSGSWSIENINNIDEFAQYTPFIALDSQNHPHISYTDSNSMALKYAHKEFGIWSVSTLDSSSTDIGKNSCIAVDKNDHVHISYIDNEGKKLKYISNSSGSWDSNEIADVDSSNQTILSVDNNYDIYIAYVSQYSNVTYIEKKMGTWSQPEKIVYSSSSWSFGLDTYGKPNILYRDSNSQHIINAVNAGNNWKHTSYGSFPDGFESYNRAERLGIDPNSRFILKTVSDLSYHDVYKYEIQLPAVSIIPIINYLLQ